MILYMVSIVYLHTILNFLKPSTAMFVVVVYFLANSIRCIIKYFSCYSPEYNVNYYKQFNVVMNALDNRGEVVSETVLNYLID